MFERSDPPERAVFLYGGHTEHSLAPRLWNYAFKRLGTAASYIPVNVETSRLARVLEDLQQPHVIGANVTIPLKEAAAQYASRPDSEVLTSGATNWLYGRSGLLYAANTDVSAARKLTGGTWTQVMLLGAGGGAAAVAAGMSARARRMVVADIDARRSRALCDRIRSWGVSAETTSWASRRAAVKSSDVLVNATPLGMAGELADANPVSAAWVGHDVRIYDLVYAPTVTPLARLAQDCGIPLIDGIAHLYHQALALLPHMHIEDPSAPEALLAGVANAFDGRTPVDWSA